MSKEESPRFSVSKVVRSRVTLPLGGCAVLRILPLGGRAVFHHPPACGRVGRGSGRGGFVSLSLRATLPARSSRPSQGGSSGNLMGATLVLVSEFDSPLNDDSVSDSTPKGLQQLAGGRGSDTSG